MGRILNIIKRKKIPFVLTYETLEQWLLTIFINEHMLDTIRLATKRKTCSRKTLAKNIKQCRDPGSNRGPLDLQSNALPTELSRQIKLEDQKRKSDFCLIIFSTISANTHWTNIRTAKSSKWMHKVTWNDNRFDLNIISNFISFFFKSKANKFELFFFDNYKKT